LSSKRLDKIEKQLHTITEDMQGLQDTILFLKSSLEPIVQTERERSFIAQMKLKSGRQVSKFLNERFTECNLWEWCSRRVEKATSLILQAFIEEGPSSAIQEADHHIQSALAMREDNPDCPDVKGCNEECYKNIVNTFESLKELLETYHDLPSGSRTSKKASKSNIEHLVTDQISGLLKPISNKVRLEILKELGKGGRHYATLEKKIGIRGGHLQYHIDTLLNAGYISKDKNFGNYHLTRDGIKILSLVFQLQDSIQK
jgi:DNA-binding HxlR family transcriptional regulator